MNLRAYCILVLSAAALLLMIATIAQLLDMWPWPPRVYNPDYEDVVRWIVALALLALTPLPLRLIWAAAKRLSETQDRSIHRG